MCPVIREPTWIENKAGFLTWSAYNFCLFALSHCLYVKHGVSSSHLERISAVWLCGILCRIKLSVLFNKETLSYSLTTKNILNKKSILTKTWQVMLHFDLLLSICFGVHPGLSFARSGFPVLFQGMNAYLLFNACDLVEYPSDGRSWLCSILSSVTSAFPHPCVLWFIFKSLSGRVKQKTVILFPGFEHFLPF